MEDTRNSGVIEVVYLPFVSCMETQLASSVAYEDDYSKEDISDMVLHEPQLQALQALEQWSDNFSAHLLPSREDTHEEEEGSSGDWDVTCTASSYDTASTTPGLLCMPCGMGKTVILSHFLKTSNKFNGSRAAPPPRRALFAVTLTNHSGFRLSLARLYPKC
eukprot:2103241-Pleurochrysis_carterae.AAC.1